MYRDVKLLTSPDVQHSCRRLRRFKIMCLALYLYLVETNTYYSIPCSKWIKPLHMRDPLHLDRLVEKDCDFMTVPEAT